jgi:CRP-like cAMP-binding protein
MVSPPAPPRASENKILAALGDSGTPHFASGLARVELAQGEVVCEPYARVEHVYFPETAVLSMLATMEDGSTAEVGPVGEEGMFGLAVFFGGGVSPARVLVHVAGTAMRLGADALRGELGSGRSRLAPLLLRYTELLLDMTSQSSACNKLHTLEQQLARWLLAMHDYVGEDELLLTHELISLTLGVRRAGVTEAAGGFRRAGLIAYHRGHIKILDRRGLEAMTCECYRVIRDYYDRLYSDLPKLAA